MPPMAHRPTANDWWNKLVVSLELADLSSADTRERLDTAAAMANSQGVQTAAAWRYGRALPMLTAAAEIWARLEQRPAEVMALNARGAVDRKIGDYDAALADHERALELAQTYGLHAGVIQAQLGLGAVRALQEEPDEAERHLAEAQTISAATGERWGVAQAHYWTGLAEEARKDFAFAQAAYETGRDIWQSMQAPAERIEAVAGLARALLAQGYTLEAYRAAEQILAHLGRDGPARLEEPLRVYWTLYRVLHVAQEQDSAEEILRMASLLLVQQADGLSPEQRATFREQVPVNRAIAQAWANLGDVDNRPRG